MHTTNATSPSQPTLSASKRAASQISGDAPDDSEQKADTAAAANARSAKAQILVNEYTKLLCEKYNDRDDIEIISADLPEKKCCRGGWSRLESICGLDINLLPLKSLRVIFSKESIPRFSDHTKKEICDIIVDLKLNGKKNIAYSRKSSRAGKSNATAVGEKGTPRQELQHAAAAAADGGDSSIRQFLQASEGNAAAAAVIDKGTPRQEHQHAAAGGDSSSRQYLQASDGNAAAVIRKGTPKQDHQHAAAGGDSSSRQYLEAANPAIELMVLLQAKLERLRKSQKVAYEVGLVDDVKGYNMTIKEVEKEIDGLEDAKIDQLRRDAAAAAADNH